MELITKAEMDELGCSLCGPIAEGETPEEAISRMVGTFHRREVKQYAFVLYDEPIYGDETKQQFPTIIGTVWAK